MEFIRFVLWNDLNSIDKCGVDFVQQNVLHIESKNVNDFVFIQIDPQVYALFYITIKLQRKLKSLEPEGTLRLICEEFLNSFIYVGELKVFMEHFSNSLIQRLPVLGVGLCEEMGFPLGLQRILYHSTVSNSGLLQYRNFMNSDVENSFYYIRYNELLVIHYKF